MMEELLPPAVACVERRNDNEPPDLLPEEAVLVKEAVEGRRREFATARLCARAALGKLGVPAAAILSGCYREPLWPRGVAGSITHCHAYRAAAVAMQADYQAVGIDAEVHEPLPADVRAHICTHEELAWLKQGFKEDVYLDKVLFSAKEAVYKAWFPLTQRWLGFKDVVMTLELQEGRFHAALCVEPPVVNGCPLTEFQGRFLVRDGLVLAATTIPARFCERTGRTIGFYPPPSQIQP